MTRDRSQKHEIAAAGEDAGKRIDRLLAERLPDLSRSRIKSLIEAGCLSARGATIDEPSSRVKQGELYLLDVPPAQETALVGQAIPLSILYEDSSVIVIDKPAGLVVHPAPGNPDRTLVNALLAHCGESLTGIGGERRPGIVHRLDKDTSGVMVAARTAAAHASLTEQFAARTIDRIYQALVWGRPLPPKGEIHGDIGRSPANRKKMAVVARGGKPAETHYETVRIYGGGAVSRLACRLKTGRTHQIRVHMAHKGHPLLGDPLYGRSKPALLKSLPESARGAVLAFPRQALHAQSLGFRHPVSGEPLEFESQFPEDMANLIAILAAV